ncbi:MAG: pyridoxal 5'-phosphate synthase glutaminase subunit PdxT [candidate division Zixibacteria bacterium]|nr:pyridoxal 5'-phosphate synthase glutaminase subunit PdxT [candidate division Zixibacteria bacterium]
MSKYSKLTVGVLALQGDYQAHITQIEKLGAKARQVKLPADLVSLDAIIIPGGESTTMNILLDRFKLREPMTKFCGSKPTFGTCAGMIMLSKTIEDNLSGVKPLGLLDIDVLRNGYGRQIFSFEDNIPVDSKNGLTSLTGTFIRAPKITRKGSGVATLASYRESPVLVSEGNILASSFHTELGSNTSLLQYFLDNFVPDKSI